MNKKLLIGIVVAVLLIVVALPLVLSWSAPPEQGAQQEGPVRVRVCSTEGVLFDEEVDATGLANARELITKAVGVENVTFDNAFITSVLRMNGIVYYALKNDGTYEAPAVSVSKYELAGVKELVFYHYTLAPMAVEAKKEGEEVTLTVTKAVFDANFVIMDWQPLEGATAKLADNTVLTDAEGKALLPIPAGADAESSIIEVYAKNTAGEYTTIPDNIALNAVK